MFDSVGSKLRARLWTSVFVVAGVVAPASAQTRVDGGGRLLDANPQIGGGRFNYARPVSPLMNANLMATGNARFGQSLRSFSPIGDPSSFRAPLGSGTLSAFVRDSVGVRDQPFRSLGRGVTPFFDPSRTAPTVGMLRNTPAPTRRMFPFDSRTVTRTRPGLFNYQRPLGVAAPSIDERGATGDAIRRLTPSELTSTVFGPAPLRAAEPLSLEAAQRSPFEFHVGGDDSSPGGSQQPLDLRATREPLVKPIETRLDMLLDADGTRLLTERASNGSGIDAVESLGELRELANRAEAQQLRAPQTTPLDESLLPGADVFTDLQLALSLGSNPDADWFREMQQQAAAQPGLASEYQDMLELDAAQFVQKVLTSQIETFVGRNGTALNDTLAEAEAAMDAGRYYDAAADYERARIIDVGNPLPLIGKAHALLAAGEYRSAAVDLVRGLERFPELTRVNLNLESLMGGGEIVDIRRAAIMRMLDRKEDASLRFLLGYLEYNSDNRESGLRNLDKAAAESDIGTLIQHYPDLLRGKRVLPPPKLPSGSSEPLPKPTRGVNP